MDIEALQATLRSFAAERDWQPFHTPKNLATALIVEAAELAEIFQWMTPDQSIAAHTDMGRCSSTQPNWGSRRGRLRLEHRSPLPTEGR